MEKSIEEIKKERVKILFKKIELEKELEEINKQLELKSKELYEATLQHKYDQMERRKSK